MRGAKIPRAPESSHPLGMAKRKFRGTFIRDWRKKRGLTLARLADRIEMTTSNLSKIERGTQPYTQPVLEALATALNCSPADLIMRPPEARNDLLALVEALEEDQQRQAIAVIKALSSKAA